MSKGRGGDRVREEGTEWWKMKDQDSKRRYKLTGIPSLRRSAEGRRVKHSSTGSTSLS